MTLSFDQLVLEASVDTFGEIAQGYPLPIYTPVGFNPFGVDGVFDAGFVEVDPLLGPPIASASPKFGARLSQIPAGVVLAQGDGITIRGQNYLVREVRPDSHGHVLLLLNEAP